MAAPPVLWDIESDPVLANVKLIAEAWDAAGLYQVGSFAGDSWKEWNGRFRDDVRAFLKGDNGTVGALACRLTGSPDVYEHERREPEQSVNFVTCHDGFTLNDLVSYNAQAQRGERRGEPRRHGRQPQLELRRRGPDRRPGDRAAAQPPGEELPRADPAFGGHADAARGRRGPPHAARQQQRLLPGRRDVVVRLVARREARRRPSLHQGARRAAHDPAACRSSGSRCRSASSCAQAAGRVARREAERAGLERRVALARRHQPAPLAPARPARDDQCVLGAARVRGAAAGPARESWRRSSTRPSIRPTTSASGPMPAPCGHRRTWSSRARSCCCSPKAT